MEKSPAEVKKVAVNAGGAGGSASGAGVDGGASADEDGVSYEYECFDSSRMFGICAAAAADAGVGVEEDGQEVCE